MIKIDAVAHIGITVADLERSVQFYCDNFGFTYLRGAHFAGSFFEKNFSLYQLPPETIKCRTAILESPNKGVQLELFLFSEMLENKPVPWNRNGITHFAVTTNDVESLVEQMKKNNVEFCMEPGIRPDNGRWVFVKDPDGNLIEIMEPFRM